MSEKFNIAFTPDKEYNLNEIEKNVKRSASDKPLVINVSEEHIEMDKDGEISLSKRDEILDERIILNTEFLKENLF